MRERINGGRHGSVRPALGMCDSALAAWRIDLVGWWWGLEAQLQVGCFYKDRKMGAEFISAPLERCPIATHLTRDPADSHVLSLSETCGVTNLK